MTVQNKYTYSFIIIILTFILLFNEFKHKYFNIGFFNEICRNFQIFITLFLLFRIKLQYSIRQTKP